MGKLAKAGLLLALCSTPCWAQDLRQVAQIVVDSNPRIEAQRQVVAQLRAKVAAARSGALPSFEGSALLQRRRLSVAGGPGDQSFTIGQGDVEARLPLADGGRTSAAVDTARAELENGQAVLETVIEDTLLDLVTAAADLQSALVVQGYVRQQRQAIAQQVSIAKERLEVRDATYADVAQAEARLASSDAAALDAEEAVAASALRFEAIAGVQPTPGGPDLPDLPVGPPSLDDATSRALADAPAMRAARAAAEAGTGLVRSAKAAFAPSVEAVAGYQYLTGGVANLFTGRLPNDRSATYGGVSARVPLFQRGSEYAELRRARAVSGQRAAQVAETAREVTRDLALSWERRRAAAAIVDAGRQAVIANETALKGVTREAQLGARTTLDVLDAQAELLTAKVTEQRALRGQFVARATVLNVLGLMRPALIGEASAR